MIMASERGIISVLATNSANSLPVKHLGYFWTGGGGKRWLNER